MTTQTTPVPVPAAGPEGPRPGRGWRITVQVLGVALSLLLIAWGALSIAGLLARATETRSGTYRGISTIDLDLGFESVEIVGSSRTTSVSLDREYRGSLSKPSIGSRQDGDRLELSSSCPFDPGIGCSGHVRLVVPPDVRVQGRTGDGHLTVRDLTGPVDASTSDGGVDVSGLSGRVTLHTADGHMTLRDLTGPVTASTSDGGVEVSNVTQSLAVQTGDGSVDATDLRAADVTVQTSDGRVRLAFVAPPTSVRAQSGDGSVDVTVPQDGTRYDVAVETRDGSRQVSVPVDSQSDRRIEVRTGDGGVRVADTP
jgi:hypothetical protein